MKRKNDKKGNHVFEDEAISVIKRCRLESGEVGIFEEPPYISRFPRTDENGDPVEAIDFRNINTALKELADMRRFRQGLKFHNTPDCSQSSNDSQPMDEVSGDLDASHYP